MSTTSFMPKDDAGKAALLEHLAETLPKYAELLHLSSETLAALEADKLAFRYALNDMDLTQGEAMHRTALKNLLRDGGSASAQWPAQTQRKEPPAIVPPGIVTRLYALAAMIKAQDNYTTAIGQETWLIGYAQVVDPNTWKPVLSCHLDVGHPVIVWIKGKATAIEIWVDHDDGKGFVFLAVNTHPNTTDSTPLPAAGMSAVWKYKAVYLLHDKQVGQWSDVLNVTVSG